MYIKRVLIGVLNDKRCNEIMYNINSERDLEIIMG